MGNANSNACLAERKPQEKEGGWPWQLLPPVKFPSAKEDHPMARHPSGHGKGKAVAGNVDADKAAEMVLASLERLQ